MRRRSSRKNTTRN